MKQKLNSADEYDAVTGWRKVLKWRPGQRKRIKNRLVRLLRREGKKQSIEVEV